MQIETMNPIKSPSLYRLTGDLLDALGEITVDQETGEVTGFELFDALVIDTEAKIVNCGLALRHFDDMTNEIDAEIKRLRKRKEVIQKASERMQNRMLAAMRIMEQRVYNDVRNKTNRLNNCEMANIDKVVTANVAARKAIEYLQQAGDFDALPAPLRQAAQLRMDWPDLSLAQLVEKSPEPISKSGLSHRLKKLEQLAGDLRQRRNDV